MTFRTPFLLLVAGAASACAYPARDDGDEFRPPGPVEPPRTVEVAGGDTYVYSEPAPEVVYVDEPTYVDRVYFYEPDDYDHVYWYEDNRPDVVFYGGIVRERGQTYYVQRERDRERRIRFDERAARVRQFDRNRGEDRLREARVREQRERAEWDRHWRDRREQWRRTQPTPPARPNPPRPDKPRTPPHPERPRR